MRKLSAGIKAERIGLRRLLQGRCVQSGQYATGKRRQMLLRAVGTGVSVGTAVAERPVRRPLRRRDMFFRQLKGRQRRQVLLRINSETENRRGRNGARRFESLFSLSPMERRGR